ncbi:MAG TPA: radical SAM protein [Candidatus Kapabacteria bacterium]|nr:radical SAM protein [Candidatus Kapabacteria bacterium]
MQKILLVLLPFWTPLIPPMGMACLKSFLQANGCRVKTIDANTDERFRNVYDHYFDTLKGFIPVEKQGNFYNTGIDVLQNHLTACLHRDKCSKDRYNELLLDLVEKNFFHVIDENMIMELNKLIVSFYQTLEKYILELLAQENPDVLGISVYKGTFAASLFGFQLTRERYPHIMTVMGGGIFADQLATGSPNFNFFLESTPYIDKVIVGEGELLFLKLLKNEFPAAQKVLTRSDINSTYLDITTVDIPDFSDFGLEYYSESAAYTSRSCPFQCGFCAETVNWGKYRRKPAVQVVKEMNRLYEQYGSQLFLLTDSLLNPIIDELANELIASPQALYWDGYIRADKETCDLEKTILWRRGGLYRARLGIESGSEHVLKLMDKRLTPPQIKAALFGLSQAGIKTSTYWVIGYPGETEADFQDTLNILSELKDYIYEAECNPFRYYLAGQVNSGTWSENNKSLLLFPAWAKDLLIMQTWVLAGDGLGPSRDEIYARMQRFVLHCEKLGIPNPYSWQDIYKADERWRKLHANAVRPLIEYKNNETYINECKKVGNIVFLKENPVDEGDFAF